MVTRSATLLVLLPPVSAVVLVAARWLGRLAARHLRAFRVVVVFPPSSSSFRVALYRRRRSGGGEEEQCAFCLSGVEEGDEVRELRCRHLFHRPCLDRWLLARPLATCPLCRCRLDDGEEEEEADSDLLMFVACVHSRSSWLWPS